MKHAMHIRHLSLIEMPGLKPQFRRPFDLVGRPEELDSMIQDIVKEPEDVNDERASVNRLAPYINSFLRYSGHAQPAFAPPNGWGARRYSFQLEVEIKPVAFTGTQTLIILGYTDDIPEGSQEMSADEMLDHVTFEINSIMTARSYTEQTETGPQLIHQMVANQHLYSDPNWNGLMNQKEWIEAVRPCDIFSRMAMELRMPSIDSATVIDTRTVITNMPRTSDRLNVNPAYLLTKVLNGYLNAKEHTYADMDRDGLYEEARSYVEESPAGLNPLLRELVGERSGGPSKSFKMADLMRLDITVKDRTVVVVGNSRDKDLVDGGLYTSMDEESLESQIAYSLAMGVPALLASVGITQAAFTLASHGTNGNPRETGLQFEMIDLAGFGYYHDNQAKEAFFLDLLTVLLPQITANYTIPVFIDMEARLNGMTVIDVRLKANGEKKRFILPTFMDTLISPVLARKTDEWSELAYVADGVGKLLDELTAALPTE